MTNIVILTATLLATNTLSHGPQQAVVQRGYTNTTGRVVVTSTATNTLGSGQLRMLARQHKLKGTLPDYLKQLP